MISPLILAAAFLTVSLLTGGSGDDHETPPLFVFAGSLTNVTLFRFAHIYRSPAAGGMEGYLWSLNRRLLERNRMRILQMYLARAESRPRIDRERVGKGELVWVPALYSEGSHSDISTSRWLWNKVRRRFAVRPSIQHGTVLSALSETPVDLGVFHWFSDDSPVVLNHLRRSGVPIAAINHFENRRLATRAVRNQIASAVAIGGVSDVDVPASLTGSFTNLSDGVDIDFFDPARVRRVPTTSADPVILLPSRITPGKGHLDAIRALAHLRKRSHRVQLVFPGRVESQNLYAEIVRTLSVEGMNEHVTILGELTPEDLRDWYGASALVVLPSQGEGLGRVLLEAQAMAKPVVAYAAGGMTAALRDGISGHLVRRRHFRDLAERIEPLVTDATMRREMGLRGREWVATYFSLDALAERHERFCVAATVKNHLRANVS